jgi:redox-sensing transcriptional repressor
MRDIPGSTVVRLPLYLRTLVDLAASGERTVSSDILAEATGLTSAQVRKDLSNVGSVGTRGIGYDVASLIHVIRRVLGLTQHWAILIAGVGNLGRALAHYKGFAERGFRVVALVDVDPEKVGMRLDELEIRPIGDLAALAMEHAVGIGVIATPASAAQEVADRMVAAGIRSILNFAPAVVTAPEGVTIRKVDLATELQILAYYDQRNAGSEEVEDPRDASAGS